MKRKYAVVDSDGHVSEPLDLWKRYLEADVARRAHDALRMVNHPGGGVSACLEGRFIGPPTWQGAGGFGKKAPDLIHSSWGPEGMNPGGFDPQARIKDMDAMGITVAVLFPSMCLLVNAVTDAELAADMCGAFNRYLADFCRPFPKRLVGAAMAPMQSVTFMTQTATDAAKLGHKAVILRPNMVNDRSLGHSYYEPFWAAVQDLDLAVALHAASTGELFGAYQVIARPDPDVHASLPDAVCLPADIMITLMWLMISGTLDKFPKARIGMLEASGGWVSMFLERLDKRVRYSGGPGTARIPHMRSLPSEIFARQCYVAFESEEAALPRMADVLGDTMIWASDYPHFDGEPPGEAIDNLSGVPEETTRRILSGNAMRLYGLA